MRKYGRRHTLPYLLSLALEYLAYSLRCSSTSRLATNKASGPMLPVKTETELERQETSKRARQFWWYLVRGPVWEGWTKYAPSSSSSLARFWPRFHPGIRTLTFSD